MVTLFIHWQSIFEFFLDRLLIMPIHISVQKVFIFLVLTHGTINNYETHIKNLTTVIDNDNTLTIPHVPFTASAIPSSTFGTDSKVCATDVVFFYFPSALTSSDKDAIMSSVETLWSVMGL